MSKTYGLLSTVDSPLLDLTLAELKKHKTLPSAIIIDGALPEKSKSILKERFEGNIFWKNIWELDLGNIPVYFVSNHNSESCVRLVESLKLDFLLNVGTPRILKAEILSATLGVVNCHPGRLPDYRGCTTVEWAILENSNLAATAHLMVEKIDEGDIISIENLRVEKFENYFTVRKKMLFHQAMVLAKAASFLKELVVFEGALQKQGIGKYFKPIPTDLLSKVKEKLESGSYQSS